MDEIPDFAEVPKNLAPNSILTRLSEKLTFKFKFEIQCASRMENSQKTIKTYDRIKDKVFILKTDCFKKIFNCIAGLFILFCRNMRFYTPIVFLN